MQVYRVKKVSYLKLLKLLILQIFRTQLLKILVDTNIYAKVKKAAKPLKKKTIEI